MTIVNPTYPIGPYPGIGPVPQTQPFTYRDGEAYYEQLVRLVKWVNVYLIPTLSDQMTNLGDEFTTEINDLITQVNNAVQEVINSSITLQDPVMAGIMEEPTSATRIATDALYATIASVTSASNRISTLETLTDTGRLGSTALAAQILTAVKRNTGLNVLDYGAVGDGVNDDTAAIQAAQNALQPGQQLIFPFTGPDNFYKISSPIVVNTQNTWWKGSPRDGYAISIRTGSTTITMVSVTAAGFAMEDIALFGTLTNDGVGNANGANCTVTGLEVAGDNDGNMDCAIHGCTFQYLALGILLDGRNAQISEENIFSNCRAAIKHNGKATWQTGANATQNRGNVITNNRFHNIGTVVTDNAIEFTALSLVLHCIIANNFFDSNGLGAHIVVTGTSVNTARGVSIWGNKHTEAYAEMVRLTYCDYPMVSDFYFIGQTAAGPNANAIVLTNCTYPIISNGVIRYVSLSGIIGTNNSNVQIANIQMLQIGQHATNTGDAINFDNTNSNVRVSNVKATTVDGAFFRGDPTGSESAIANCSYGSTTAGIVSNTVMHVSSRGQNTYVEGRMGNVESCGYGQYTMAAATTRTLATITSASSFGSFVLEIEFTGRDSTSGNAYFSGKKIIRTENGVPVITTVNTDANTGLTVTLAASGSNGISVSVQAATAMQLGARVRAVAGGGPNGITSQGVTVTMLAQP